MSEISRVPRIAPDLDQLGSSQFLFHRCFQWNQFSRRGSPFPNIVFRTRAAPKTTLDPLDHVSRNEFPFWGTKLVANRGRPICIWLLVIPRFPSLIYVPYVPWPLGARSDHSPFRQIPEKYI